MDNAESELGILDLIQVFVEVLDKCFENVCELDIIFNSDKVHYILDELVMGGMVLETSAGDILDAIIEMNMQDPELENQLWMYLVGAAHAMQNIDDTSSNG